jgi:hypothetical protein
VVEGTLKSGARHIYSKRTLFLDEDSWQAAVVDQYDGRGDLWRVSIAYLKNYYDLPTTWSALDSFHDLQARRYHVQNLDNEGQAPSTSARLCRMTVTSSLLRCVAAVRVNPRVG